MPGSYNLEAIFDPLIELIRRRLIALYNYAWPDIFNLMIMVNNEPRYLTLHIEIGSYRSQV